VKGGGGAKLAALSFVGDLTAEKISHAGHGKMSPFPLCSVVMLNYRKFFRARLTRFAICFARNQTMPSGCAKIRPSLAYFRPQMSGKSNPASTIHRQQLDVL
jgi:hypothetical protein